MLRIIIGVLFSLAIAAGLAMISLVGCRLIALWSLFIIFLLSLLALLFIAYWYWGFSNRKWKFKTTDIPNREWPYFNSMDTAPYQWRSQKPQEVNMTYEIVFHRKQTVESIHCSHGYSFETPLRWRMDFLDKTSNPIPICGHRLPYIETGDPETKPNSSEILVELKQPIRAYGFRITVKEPAIANGETQHWRVEAVFVRVRIFFGLKSHTIGKFCLDKL